MQQHWILRQGSAGSSCPGSRLKVTNFYSQGPVALNSLLKDLRLQNQWHLFLSNIIVGYFILFYFCIILIDGFYLIAVLQPRFYNLKHFIKFSILKFIIEHYGYCILYIQ